MGPDGKILVSCRMTPEEVVERDHLNTNDVVKTRAPCLLDRILEDIEIAKGFDEKPPVETAE